MSVIDIFPLAPAATFDQFCARHNLRIEVHERSPELRRSMNLSRWYAVIRGLEYVSGSFTTATSGNAETPDEAVRDLAARLVGKQLTKDDYRFWAPSEWMPEVVSP